MMFSKTAKLKFQAKCGIHDTDLAIKKFETTLPNTNIGEVELSICRVDDGCEPEHYFLDRVD